MIDDRDESIDGHDHKEQWCQGAKNKRPFDFIFWGEGSEHCPAKSLKSS